MSTAWFSGIAPATAEVRCGAETHTVQWQDGAFSIPAHPDPDGERALAALAGEACACVELLDAWHRHNRDPQVLILGPRGHETLGAARTDRGAGWRAHRSGLIQLGMAQDPGDSPLEALLGLDGAIPRRLVATVAAALLERSAEPEVAGELYGALYGRLLASFWTWRASFPELDLDVVDSEPSLTLGSDSRCHARLSLGWLTDVWARDLDVVEDQLTLAARPLTGGGGELLIVDHQFRLHTRVV